MLFALQLSKVGAICRDIVSLVPLIAQFIFQLISHNNKTWNLIIFRMTCAGEFGGKQAGKVLFKETARNKNDVFEKDFAKVQPNLSIGDLAYM
jgi:hypothetical protein